MAGRNRAPQFGPPPHPGLLVLKGDYDRAGMEAFKREILGQHAKAMRLPIIAAPSSPTITSLPRSWTSRPE